MRYQGFVGTYTTDRSEGIYSFEFDQKKIYDTKLFAKVRNPKYVCFVEDKIASVCDFDSGSGIAVYDFDGNCISQLIFEHKTSCYITYRDSCFYTANFHEGTLSIVSFQNNELKLVKQIQFQEKAGCHEVLFYKDLVLVPCLHMDQIQVLKKDGTILEPIQFESHAGCRHGVFSNNQEYLYVVGELSNCLYAIDMKSRKVVKKLDLAFDFDCECASAAIKTYGDDMLISIRGANVIRVVHADGENMSIKTTFDTFGEHPRDFFVIDDFLFVANRDSDSLNVFDLKNGYLNSYIGKKTVSEGVCVIVRRA